MPTASRLVQGNVDWRYTHDVYTKSTGNRVRTSSYQSRVVRRTFSLSKTWTNTPNFRQRIVDKTRLPDNPFTFRTETYSQNFGRVQIRSETATTSRNEDWWTTGSLLPYESRNLFKRSRNGVNGKLINRAKGSQINLPVFFAEAGKTTRMVYEHASRIARMAHSLIRGDPFTFFRLAANSSRLTSKVIESESRRFNRAYGRNPAKAAANYWLSWRYGYIPLMSDVSKSVHLLMDLSEMEEPMIGTVTASERSLSVVKTAEAALTNFTSGSVRNVMFTSMREELLSTRAVWRFAPDPADIPGRFGLINPAEVVWELVPLSFVADWFLPIGDYLSSLDARFRFTHKGGSYGDAFIIDAVITPTRISPATNVVSWSGFAGRSRCVNVAREPMSAAPTIKLLDLSFGSDLGTNKMVSALALLTQRVSKLSNWANLKTGRK